MGVTAANIPNFSGKASLSLADLQALADVVRANMLQAEQPPARVRVGVARPRPAHDVPPGGAYFGESFVAPVPSQVSRPGLVQSLEFMAGLERPAFVHGKGYIPLAETESADGVVWSSPVAGGLAGVQWAEDSSVSAPRIRPGGLLEIPRGGGAMPPLAEWEPPDKSVPGLIQAVYFSSGVEQPKVSFGNVYIPEAATVDTYFQPLASAVVGAIAGVQYATESDIDQPRILPGGILELPQPGAEGGALQGLQDATGNAVSWSGVESMPGGQVKVASVLLNTGSTNIPLSLYAGLNNGFLTFGLVDTI
jgi:hypothetical protein